MQGIAAIFPAVKNKVLGQDKLFGGYFMQRNNFLGIHNGRVQAGRNGLMQENAV
jgi:hypothetical protein